MSRLIAWLVPVAIALAGCATQGPAVTDPEPGADVEAWSGELPISAPWLRERLPDNLLTYQRIPNLLGLLGMPKGNSLDGGLGSDANIRNFQAIQRGLLENLVDDSPVFSEPVYRLLVNHLRSPIELVGVGFPQPSVMLGMTLDLRSRSEFETLLSELGTAMSVPGLAAPLDADGYGRLAAPLPILLRFEEDTGRLALYGSVPLPGAAPPSRDTLAELLQASAEPVAHPMHAIEAQVDESGQGLFGWINTTQALGIAAMFGAMPPETVRMLEMTGLDQLQSVAYGTGVANGKGRIKLIADVGSDRSARAFPVLSNQVAATAVGDPTSLLLLSIPSAAELDRLEDLALSYFPPEVGEQWDAMKLELAAEAGASLEEILAALGPEIVGFSDRAGNFVALKVRDPVLLDDVLQRLTANAGIAIEDRVVAGQIIRHLTLPTGDALPARGDPVAAIPGAEMVSDPAQSALAIISRMRTRLFWVDEGDYLYFANLPQSLMDRDSFGATTNIGTWLDQTQRVDLSSSLVAATGTVARLPRMMYEFYVGTMQSIADMVEVDYDLWAMPSAGQLGLPERGTLGLAFNLGEPHVSLEMTFESNPGEVLFAGGGAASAAAAGILAAIAIPAYQDYAIRAQVSDGLNLAAATKAAVVETWLDSGQAPADRSAAGMTAAPTDTQSQFVQSIDITDGAVIMQFGNAAHARLTGQTLVQTPYATGDGSVVWVCGYAVAPAGTTVLGASPGTETTVAAEFLPSACRG